jgi:hypothetical protein
LGEVLDGSKWWNEIGFLWILPRHLKARLIDEDPKDEGARFGNFYVIRLELSLLAVLYAGDLGRAALEKDDMCHFRAPFHCKQ